jgi:hypothetical protein
MGIAPGRPGQSIALATAPIKADFQARLRNLRDAANDWGVRPDHPEGLFISAMIVTQEGFADLAMSFAEAMDAIVSKAAATAEDGVG